MHPALAHRPPDADPSVSVGLARASLARRRAALVLAVLTFGCGGRSAPAAEDVYVQDPTTLAAVRALHAPPEVSVDVERVTHARGGTGGSCHSAACLILLPALVAGALLPPEVTQHATVTTAGVTSYVATFDAQGGFVIGQVRDGDAWRELRALPLERLGRRPIVSTRRVQRDEAGRESRSERMPILPQAPLDQAYRAALQATDEPEARGALLVEALTWLGPEADALVLSRLRQPALHDEERAAPTAWYCGEDVRDEARRAEVARLARDHGGVASVFAALRCVGDQQALAAELAVALARPYCEGDHPDEALAELHRRRALDATVEPFTRPPTLRCDGPRGELLRALWGGRTADVDPAVVAQGFRHDVAGAQLLALQPHYEPGMGLTEERQAWLAWHLDVAARALALEPATCPVERCDAFARELAAAETSSLSDAMLDAVVDHYAALPTVDRDDRRRATLLGVLHRASRDATHAERLRRRLEAHETRLAPDARPALATARVVLGDATAAADSLRGAANDEGALDAIRAAARYGTATLIREAWKTYLGCSDADLQERVAAAHAGRPVAVCAHAPR